VLKANLGVVAPQRLVGPPDLVVEIASPSTAAYDRDPVEGKRGAYASMGVPEYWLVDPATRTVEVLALDGASYRSLGSFHGDEPVRSQVIPGDTLLAGRLFPREV
jgi:Uma2 family endonuclease